jgi:hypothetical protein
MLRYDFGMKAPKIDALGRPMDFVYRHTTHLAGLSHANKNGLDRRKIAKRLRVGSQLVLQTEPDNPADQDAILVFPADDLSNDIGYLYSFTARSVARKMRSGVVLSAEISTIDRSDPWHPQYGVYVYQLTKNGRMEPKRSSDEYYERPQSFNGNEIYIPAKFAPRAQGSVKVIRSIVPAPPADVTKNNPKGFFAFLRRLLS